MNAQYDPRLPGVLLDFFIQGPYLGLGLALIEPVKSVYDAMRSADDPTKKLGQCLAAGGLATIETVSIGMLSRLSDYSIRELPDQQGPGDLHHAR